MQKIVILLSLYALIAHEASASDDFLSVKFSKKNQLRTGMTWIKFKPKLIMASKPKKRKKREARPPRRAKDTAQKVNSSLANLPYSSVGKLFFTRANDQVSSCSAAFAGGPDVIVTAAHCVMSDDGEWNGDFLFIRSYGSDNHDVYAIQCVAVPGEWGEITGNEILPHDYAFLRTTRISKGGSLQVANDAPPQELTIIGYSDNHSDGKELLELRTRVMTSSGDRLGSAKNPFGVGNSGSPWIESSKVFSVSSHYFTDQRQTMWGPRMTMETLGLMKYTKNGCESS